MKINSKITAAVMMTLLCPMLCLAQRIGKIDREQVVKRHNVRNLMMDTLASLTVGNGAFAYTVDATGMQSFPLYYRHGVSLGTQSEWG